MGIVLVEYILHALVHSFDWKLPYRVVELNMDESFGLFFFVEKRVLWTYIAKCNDPFDYSLFRLG